MEVNAQKRFRVLIRMKATGVNLKDLKFKKSALSSSTAVEETGARLMDNKAMMKACLEQRRRIMEKSKQRFESIRETSARLDQLTLMESDNVAMIEEKNKEAT